MKKFISLPLIVFIGSFLLGAIVFFPVHRLRYPLAQAVSQATGAHLEMGPLTVGTGLGMGFSKGGLFALHAENVSLTFRDGKSLECVDASFAPHILPLFLAKLSLGFRCRFDEQMSVLGQLSASPAWGPSEAQASIKLNNIDLEEFSAFIPMRNLKGQIGGEVKVEDLNLSRPPGNLKVMWDLVGKDVVVPAVSSDFINLPSLPLGPLQSQGQYQPGKVVVEPLKFGNQQSPLSGNIKVDFTLDPVGMPTSGELSGSLKTDPEFEANQLKGAINLDLIFGKVDPSGAREFKKPVRGNVLSLMQPPQE